ncbi:MAG TPA: hypothetical protein VLZ30_01565, partial [Verrucomicrobiae bacterium]|nr:hypothetical protein [Verrucomicrobiae bacterium]
TTQFGRSYTSNTVVSLTAPATASGNLFQKWQRNGSDWSTSTGAVVTMNANYMMTAVYTTPPPPSVLSVSPTNLLPTTTIGQNATSQTFMVWNSGGGTLNYTVATNAAWLSISPTNGASSGATNSHTVAYGSANLAIGTYNATITVSAPGAISSPQTISVSLTVNPPPPSTITMDSGYLYDRFGTLAPLSSVAVLVADVGTNGFVDPQPTFPLSLGATWGTEDRIVGLWDLSGCSDCGAGYLFDHTTVGYTNGVAPGQKLQLYWFPSLTLASNTVGATYYGKYRDTNSPPLEAGTDAWLIPASGSSAYLALYTVAAGGSSPETTGWATFLVTAAPSAFQSWQIQYFGSTNNPNAAAGADPYGTGMSNTNKFLAGFNPTNPSAYLHIISIIEQNANVIVTYLGANGDNTYVPGVASRTNVLDYMTGDAGGNYTNGGWQDTGQTNILGGGNGSGVVTNMVDTAIPGVSTNRFYRVRVVLP